MFIFKAMKNLRTIKSNKQYNLYINDNLTSYTFSLLKHLKHERNRRPEMSIMNFDVVFCFDGRTFVKRTKSSNSSYALLISNRLSLEKFLENRNIDASAGISINCENTWICCSNLLTLKIRRGLSFQMKMWRIILVYFLLINAAYAAS